VKKRKTQILFIVGLLAVILLLASVAIGSNHHMVWWLMASGGGETGGRLFSTIGQPVAGRVENGYTLYSGAHVPPSAAGPTQTKLMLPLLYKNVNLSSRDPAPAEPSETEGLAIGRNAVERDYQSEEIYSERKTEFARTIAYLSGL